MDESSRTLFNNCCADEEQLKTLSTTYRMYKYSKWYKDLQKQMTQQTIITYPVIDQNPMENALSMS